MKRRNKRKREEKKNIKISNEDEHDDGNLG